MDRRERLGDPETSILATLQGHQAGLWTAMPAIIRKYDAAKMTVEAEPTIQAQVQAQDGSTSWVTMPMLVDCPVVFPSGGGFTLTFPVAVGDECLVIFANRCIDAWWQSGGIQEQADLRMHDLSDGFALVGPRSQPRVLSPAGSGDGVELRNDGRTAYVRIDGSGNIFATTAGNASIDADGDVYANAGADVAISAGGVASVVAPTINLTGNVTITGNLSVTGTVINGVKNIGATHVHSGVTGGASNTGAPT